MIRNQASWRGVPPQFGKWETPDKRFRRWRATGLWQRIAAVLGLDATTSATEVSL